LKLNFNDVNQSCLLEVGGELMGVLAEIQEGTSSTIKLLLIDCFFWS
jgi:hypothetical protein